MAPSLNDSASLVLDKAGYTMGEPSPRDTILRFFFCEIVLHRGNHQELSRAIKTPNIDTFLDGSDIVDIRSYHLIFTRLQIRLPSKLDFVKIPIFHCLRDAICDYVSDTHPAPPPVPPSLTILGTKVIPEGTPRKMNIEHWDCLWENFKTTVRGEHIDIFALQFEDLVTVKVLAALGRYRHWYHDNPWTSPGYQCTHVPCIYVQYRSAVMLGFIPVEQGIYCDEASISVMDGYTIKKRQQKRSYLVGRMGKSDLSLQLARELGRRIGSVLVLLWDREKESKIPIMSPPW